MNSLHNNSLERCMLLGHIVGKQMIQLKVLLMFLDITLILEDERVPRVSSVKEQKNVSFN